MNGISIAASLERPQVTLLRLMSDGQEVTSPREVKKDTKNGKESKTQDYADAWGIRKLISHCLRNLRLDRIPR